MKTYTFTGTVRREIEDIVTIKVKADNQEDAAKSATKALRSYPDAHGVPNVPYAFIENRSYQEPISITVKEVR